MDAAQGSSSSGSGRQPRRQHANTYPNIQTADIKVAHEITPFVTDSGLNMRPSLVAPVLIDKQLQVVVSVSHEMRVMMIMHRTISASTAPARASEISPLSPRS